MGLDKRSILPARAYVAADQVPQDASGVNAESEANKVADQEIGDLAKFSHETFSEILGEAQTVTYRLNTLTERASRVATDVPTAEAAVKDINPDNFAEQVSVSWKHPAPEDQQHFNPNTAPGPIADLYDRCALPPPVYLMDQFLDPASSGMETATQMYSDPGFFAREWVSQMVAQRDAAKKNKKARRATRRPDSGADYAELLKNLPSIPTPVARPSAKREKAAPPVPAPPVAPESSKKSSEGKKSGSRRSSRSRSSGSKKRSSSTGKKKSEGTVDAPTAPAAPESGSSSKRTSVKRKSATPKARPLSVFLPDGKEAPLDQKAIDAWKDEEEKRKIEEEKRKAVASAAAAEAERLKHEATAKALSQAAMEADIERKKFEEAQKQALLAAEQAKAQAAAQAALAEKSKTEKASIEAAMAAQKKQIEEETARLKAEAEAERAKFMAELEKIKAEAEAAKREAAAALSSAKNAQDDAATAEKRRVDAEEERKRQEEETRKALEAEYRAKAEEQMLKMLAEEEAKRKDAEAKRRAQEDARRKKELEEAKAQLAEQARRAAGDAPAVPAAPSGAGAGPAPTLGGADKSAGGATGTAALNTADIARLPATSRVARRPLTIGPGGLSSLGALDLSVAKKPTKPKAVRPDEPEAPTMASHTPTSISVQWKAPKDNGFPITEYILERDTGNYGWTQLYAGVDTQFEVKGLNGGSKMSVRVRAVNAGGRSEWSDVSDTFTTKPEAPNQPKPPVMYNSATTSITVRWSPPANNKFPISRYVLQASEPAPVGSTKPDSKLKWSIIFEGRDLAYEAFGLEPGLEYRFRVSAINRGGESEFSPPSEAYTTLAMPPSQMPPPNLKDKGPSTINLVWKAANGRSFPISKYEVEQDSSDGSGWQLVHEGDGLAAAITGLMSGVTYKYRIRATNAGGTSPYSDTAAYTTDVLAPAKPHAPTLLSSAPTRIAVAWVAPEDNGAPVTRYLLDRKGGADEDWTAIYQGRDTAFESIQLKPGTEYQFRVLAINAGGPSVKSDVTKIKTPLLAPEKPNVPRAAVASVDTLSISWSAPASNGSPITGYKLEADENLKGKWKEVYSGTETQAMVKGLTPATPYYFRVTAINAAGASIPSESVEQTTGADPPVKPAAPTSTGKTTASIKIAWKAPADNGSKITKYYLDMKVGAKGVWETVYVGKDLAFDVSGLDPTNEYFFQVSAYNAGGKSEASDELGPLKTESLAPNQPTPPTLVERTGDSLKVSWAPPTENASPIVSFVLEYQKQGEKKKWKEGYKGPELETSIKGLDLGTFYELRVQAVNEAGKSAVSDVAKFSTSAKVPDAPKGLKESAKATYDTISLTWQAAAANGAPVEEYRVLVNSGSGFNVAYAGPETKYQMKGLPPSTPYRVKVFAVNNVGTGADSEVLDVVTVANKPAKPAAPVMKDVTTSSIRVTWEPPDARGAPITSYKLEMNGKVVYKGPDSSNLLASLKQANTYKFRVQATNATGDSEWSEEMVVSTKAAPAAPSLPPAPLVAKKAPGLRDVKKAGPAKAAASTARSPRVAPSASRFGARAGGVSILDQMKQRKLRKTSGPAKRVDTRVELMTALRKGTDLKKLSAAQMRVAKPATKPMGAGMGVPTFNVADIMRKMRKTMNEDEEDEDDEDDDEWAV